MREEGAGKCQGREGEVAPGERFINGEGEAQRGKGIARQRHSAVGWAILDIGKRRERGKGSDNVGREIAGG